MNNLFQELQKATNKKALTTLSRHFYFDYNKEIEIIKGNGVITINRLQKQFASATNKQLNNFEQVIIILLNTFRNYRNLSIASIKNGKFEIIKNNFIQYFYTYYCKKDFEEDRKRENLQFFLIAQKMENLRNFPIAEKPHNYNIDFNLYDRFKIINYDFSKWANSKNYLQYVKTLYNGKIVELFENDLRNANGTSIDNINIIFDKSGYLKFKAVERLKEKAHNLKTQRQRQKAQELDTSPEIEKAQALQKKCFLLLSECFKVVQTSQDLKAVKDIFYNNFKSVYDLQQEIENYKEYTKKGYFNNPDQKQKNIDNIIKNINNNIALLNDFLNLNLLSTNLLKGVKL